MSVVCFARSVRAGLDDIRLIALACVGATALVYQLPVLISPAWFVLPLALCLYRFPGRVLIAAACVFAAWGLIQADRQMHQRLPAAADGSQVWVRGYVSGLPEVEPYRTRFQVVDEHSGRRLRLSWYDGGSDLAAGECVDVKIKQSAPFGSANPGGFDYSGWLWRAGVDATGYVKASRRCRAPPRHSFDRYRGKALERLAPILDDSPARGPIEALSLGVRQHITDAQWQTLRDTGTTHLMAISGLHIGLIAGWVFVLAQLLALRGPAPRHARRIAAFAAMLGALGYAGLAGWALPTERAVIMVASAMLAICIERPISAAQALSWAALAVVAWHPASVIAPGFWLSFGAVGCLIGLASLVRGPWWYKALYYQFGLVIVLMPLTLWFFGQASIIAPIVNAVLIPVAGMVVPIVLISVLLALIAPGPGGWLLTQVAAAISAVWPGLTALADWPVASFHHALSGPVALSLALVGLMIIVLPIATRLRVLGVIVLLPGLFGWTLSGPSIERGALKVDVLDVGQGLASVVRTAHHTLVFDAGPAYRTGFDAGRMIVVPYLRHIDRPIVDTLMISHGDLDHIGGAPAIVEALDVRQRRGAGSRHACRQGQHWRWDAVDFDVVYPLAHATARDRNDQSCVLRVHADNASVLMTGDIEEPGERDLVAESDSPLKSDVLIVPHHGSATSSSETLLNAVDPRIALISAGWHNRWDFPKSSVIARYRAHDIAVFNTATGGALSITWPAAGTVRVERWRDRYRRFWQRPVTRAIR